MNVLQDTEKYTYNKNAPRNNSQNTSKIKIDKSYPFMAEMV